MFIITVMVLLVLLILSSFHYFQLSLDSVFMSSGMSGVLLWLSVLIILCASLASLNEKKPKYWYVMWAMMIILVMCFSVQNFISFYIFFESSLIPMLMFIISWGYQPERLQAGMYMLLYTVLGSMPMLLMMVMMYSYWGNMSIMTIKLLGMNSKMVIYLLFLLPFLVKLPVYGVHLWLPKAHVEAPLAGSMILAGVLLKLGGYGMYLLEMMLSMELAWSMVKLVIMYISLWGGLLASLMCLRQTDLKAMVAYSSIVHMGGVVLGILSMSFWGLESALITMFAHGYTSSAMFLMAFLTYQKVGTRSLYYFQGLLKVYPWISLFWFLWCCINMAAPPSVNLIGELFLIPTAYLISPIMLVILVLIMIMSVGYNMYMYSLVNHGSLKQFKLTNFSSKSMMYISLFIHLTPLWFLLSLEYFLI
uniref:NADH-ubiquinone oxidoreductase chain 4 n=1 Tax=Microceramus pontificus TaxID=513540 RepID=A0A343F259_9EUPU|nr:NADH dehydrogenase subunit 4 [Microceramus pontificus]ASP44429.1 NADH dehydrogenase subunit 4 [Microceramus pontificus]